MPLYDKQRAKYFLFVKQVWKVNLGQRKGTKWNLEMSQVSQALSKNNDQNQTEHFPKVEKRLGLVLIKIKERRGKLR